MAQCNDLDLFKRLERGERVRPVMDEERACYALISDLDYVSSHVQGSLTSKRYLQNEIWSLVSYVGAPSWFITFAPADNKHLYACIMQIQRRLFLQTSFMEMNAIGLS